MQGGAGMNWQPIEMAPPYDKYVLICTASGQIHLAYFDDDVGKWQPKFFDGNSDYRPKDVTHWMMLPDLPEK